MSTVFRRVTIASLVLTVLYSQLVQETQGQTPTTRLEAFRPWSSNSIFPQCYRSSRPHSQHIVVERVDVNVDIKQQIATTSLVVFLRNLSATQQEGEVLIPVPDGATIVDYQYLGKSKDGTPQVLAAAEAKRTFESIVAKLKDPALLEFAGMNLFRSTVFPIEASDTQQVKIVYQQLLKADQQRIDYVLPRSGSVAYATPWNITVNIGASTPITTVYSPTHQLTTTPAGQKTAKASVVESSTREPGEFRLSYLLEQGPATGSLFAFPDENGKGGYFLLLAGLTNTPDGDRSPTATKREITLVIDRSGSMRGEKLEQAKEAALQVLAGLNYGESFNVICYSDAVDKFADAPVEKTKQSIREANDFINSLTSNGGTNLHEALKSSLAQEPSTDHLPIVLFLTDGLPTVGITGEKEIRDLAVEANPHARRLFTFGVGYDVNTPLLDKLARSTRAFATFVFPSEDVEAKVGKVFRGLNGPMLAEPTLLAVNADGNPSPRRIWDMLPNAIGDIYEGDQLVLMGRYRGNKPLRLTLTGKQGSVERKFDFEFALPKKRNIDNSFVARLWAGRKIGNLIDQIRDMGAESAAHAVAGQYQNQRADNTLLVSDTIVDARLKELTDEIIQLSTEFGIINEYTSFLAREGTDLSDDSAVSQQAAETLKERAIQSRSGLASLNQEFNNDLQRKQAWANKSNCYMCPDGTMTTVNNVQQCRVGSYYRRNGLWIANGMLKQEKEMKPDQTVEFGSDDFLKIVWKLVAQNRQDVIALEGDVMVEVDGKNVLIKFPEELEKEQTEK